MFFIISFCNKNDLINLSYFIFGNSNKKERVSKTCSKQEDNRVIEDSNNIGRNKVAQRHAASMWNELNLGITVTPIFPAESGDRITVQVPKFDETFTNETFNEKLLKPIDNLYPLGSELKEIADVISRVRNDITNKKKYDTIRTMIRNYIYSPLI